MAADPEFYVTPFVHALQIAYLLVAVDRDRMQLVNDIRAQVEAIDANQAIADVKSMITPKECGGGSTKPWLPLEVII